MPGAEREEKARLNAVRQIHAGEQPARKPFYLFQPRDMERLIASMLKRAL